MNILSLYDGMACGMIAMLNAGVKVDRYVAYEIDKYAIKTATHNFPQIEECGDVFQGDFTKYAGFDFLICGSPCTYWSISQTKNRETEASGIGWELFEQIMRALNEAKPKYFIYENNKSMSEAIRTSINEAFGFEAVLINSVLVSAQNRNRLYWVGRRNADGTYSKVDVEQPIDRGILLKDVLDGAVAWQNKAYTYTTRCHGAIIENTLKRHQHTMVAEPINVTVAGKAQCLRSTCYKDGVRNIVANDVDRKTGVAEPVCVAQRGRMYCGQPQHYEARGDGKTNTLTSVEKDNRVAEPTEWDADGYPIKARSVADSKVYTVYRVSDGKITIKGKQYPIKLHDGYYIIRKLTVTECKRLQTVPEWYEFPVSDSQAYKQLGNGWTCDVITHLIKSALDEMKEECRS